MDICWANYVVEHNTERDKLYESALMKEKVEERTTIHPLPWNSHQMPLRTQGSKTPLVRFAAQHRPTNAHLRLDTGFWLVCMARTDFIAQELWLN